MCAGAIAALVACNAITGAEYLHIDTASEETNVGASSSGTSGSTKKKNDPTEEEESVHEERGQRDGGGAPETQTDAGFDASTEAPSFSDSFDRPDGPLVGNGWIEKRDRFSIAGNAVVQTSNGNYANLIVTRPESVLDAQASIDVSYGDDIDNDPSLHLRMQPASDSTGELVSYTFYAYRDYMYLDREDPGDNGAELASTAISPTLEIGKTYRMVFRVTGVDPVKVEATVLKPDGTPAATITANDASGKRITAAGRAGFGAGRGVGVRWDNFTRIDL